MEIRSIYEAAGEITGFRKREPVLGILIADYSVAGRARQVCIYKNDSFGGAWHLYERGDWGHERCLVYDEGEKKIRLISGSSRAGTVAPRGEWEIGKEPERWDLLFGVHLSFQPHEYAAFVLFIQEEESNGNRKASGEGMEA